QGDALTRRIFAPSAYRIVRNLAVVPIGHREAIRLAACFPIAWRRRVDGLELVVVRALFDDVLAQPAAARQMIPLVLQAYPFLIDPSAPADEAAVPMFDDAAADAPTDSGASVTTADGKLSKACVLRIRMLKAFARQYALTQATADALAAADLLESWNLPC